MSNISTLSADFSDNSLLEKITEFNLYPIDYVHVTWLKDLQYAQLVGLLRSSSYSYSFLSSYLLECFDLNEKYDFLFNEEEKIIALADSEELLEIILYIGIVMNENSIRSVVRREEKLKLEQCLGEDAYTFAVKKAQFLIGSAQFKAPDVLIDWQNIDRFRSFLMISGMQVLAIVYAGMSEAFKKRFFLKFPKSWSKYLQNPSDSITTRAQGLSLLLKIYKEVVKS